MDFTQLQGHENQELEDEISIDEVRNALEGFQNNKSPGDDGFTKEFYEAFFDLLGNALLESFNAVINATYAVAKRKPEKMRPDFNNCEDLLYIYFFIPQFKYMNFIYS